MNRECLSCDRTFWSRHKFNRVCLSCKSKRVYVYKIDNLVCKLSNPTKTLMSFLLLFLVGCETRVTKYEFIGYQRYPIAEYVCKGISCKGNFKDESIEGGNLVPTLPAIEIDR